MLYHFCLEFQNFIGNNFSYIKAYIKSFYLRFEEKQNIKKYIKDTLMEIIDVDNVIFSKGPINSKRIILVGWDFPKPNFDFEKIEIDLKVKEENEFVLFKIEKGPNEINKFIFNETVKFLFTAFGKQPIGTNFNDQKTVDWTMVKFILFNLEKDEFRKNLKKVGGIT